MAVADFHEQPAARIEALAGLRDEAPVDVEAGRSGEERSARLKVQDLGVEDFKLGDVGRVGDDGVEGLRCDGGKQVRLKKADAVGEMMTLGVVAGDGERGGRDVERGERCERKRMGERDGDGPRTGADVGDADGRVAGQPLQRGFHEVFGFRARDEDVGRDAEREAVEFLFSGDVLDRLVPGAALDPLAVGGELPGRERRIGVGEQEGAVDPGGAHEEQLGVAARGGQVREAGGSVGERVGEGGVQEKMVNCRRGWKGSSDSQAMGEMRY